METHYCDVWIDRQTDNIFGQILLVDWTTKMSINIKLLYNWQQLKKIINCLFLFLGKPQHIMLWT